MARLTISRASHDLLRGLTRPGAVFKDTSEEAADGTLSIYVDDETLDRLETVTAEAGIDADTFIQRLASGPLN